ncbi:MAG: ABC transporter ATP-binding protein [Deltaproteobacteria bacterium HGW-Deltaproteobacteria-4]|nr:MAG: ABC transporter ATP-binding protein [Deltaproteobacteria bacterium HGW-Deltaproteobacteria-4]
MIELIDVCKTYNQGQANEFTALRQISVSIAQQKITVLKGPSGSGKTTLLSLLGCMSRPSSGRIRLRGVRASWLPPEEEPSELDVSALPERFLTDIRRHTFGFIFQQFNLVRGINVLENVLLPALPTGEPRRESSERALRLLERFGLAAKRHQRSELLSGGEAQRVAIARALINNPRVLIADEPTAHLDRQLSLSFLALVEELRDEGKTLVIASHDPLIYSASQVDSLIELHDGTLENR